MKTLLLTTLLCLSSLAVAGAEPNKHIEKPQMLVTLDAFAYHKDMNCLATMEAAMKAIEPYIIEYDKQKQTAQAIILNFAGLKPAHEQWDAAKQCWGKP